MMPILFLLSLETGGQSGQVGEALRINGFRRPLTKNTMWAQVGRWAQNGTCPLGSAHLPTLGKCRWARFFARIPLNSKASPTCPLRPPVLNRLLKQFKAESWSCPMWTVKINKSMPERLATLATPATSRAHQRFSAVATCFSYWRHRRQAARINGFRLSPLFRCRHFGKMKLATGKALIVKGCRHCRRCRQCMGP